MTAARSGRRRLVVVVVGLATFGSVAPTVATGGRTLPQSSYTDSMRHAVTEVRAGRCGGAPCDFPTAAELGLVVVVDGRAATNISLDKYLENAWQGIELDRLARERGAGERTSPRSPAVVRRAAAWMVFNRLLEAEAERRGLSPTDVEVRQHALAELESIRAMGRVAEVVPAGRTPEEYFLSPELLAAYRTLLGSGRLGQLVTAGATDDADAQARRVAWFRATLPTHEVVVEGLPAGDSVATLPEAMYR